MLEDSSDDAEAATNYARYSEREDAVFGSSQYYIYLHALSTELRLISLCFCT